MSLTRRIEESNKDHPSIQTESLKCLIKDGIGLEHTAVTEDG
jgi:hypothetical protein